MESKVEIINLALANHGNLNRIEHLGENNPEAMQAEAHWDIALGCVLVEHAWSFARRCVPLAVMDEKPVGYAFTYAYPEDCVQARRLLPADNTALAGAGYPFEIGRSMDGRFKVILADLSYAAIEYTTKNVLIVDMPPHFINALAWRLAAEIALAMRADPGLANSCSQAYQFQLGQAKLQDAMENGPRPKRLGSWLRARHG